MAAFAIVRAKLPAMYSTCLYCHGRFGSNESVSHFPVGRRLAFDSRRGRLWVICHRCARWNLTPIEERWEAIEECERLFRGHRLRAQTEHIGLAKLRDGLTLVRIGEPLRPEFAAWRYGDVFGTRLRRTAGWLGGGAAVAATGLAIGITTGVVTGLVVVPAAVLGVNAYNYIKAYRDNLHAIHVPRDQGRPYTVFRTQIDETDLAPAAKPGEWILNFRHALGLEPLTGHPVAR